MGGKWTCSTLGFRPTNLLSMAPGTCTQSNVAFVSSPARLLGPSPLVRAEEKRGWAEGGWEEEEEVGGKEQKEEQKEEAQCAQPRRHSCTSGSKSPERKCKRSRRSARSLRSWLRLSPLMLRLSPLPTLTTCYGAVRVHVIKERETPGDAGHASERVQRVEKKEEEEQKKEEKEEEEEGMSNGRLDMCRTARVRALSYSCICRVVVCGCVNV